MTTRSTCAISYPFYDQPHQGGIATPPQRYAVFMSFSLAAGAGRADLQALLARWSAAAAVLQQGKPVGTVQPQVDVQPPADTGEAYGLSPASLTVTVGLGPSIFGDRFGLAARRPAAFTDLPPLNGDNLDPRLHGGDCRSKPAPTTPRSAITPCATWPAWPQHRLAVMGGTGFRAGLRRSRPAHAAKPLGIQGRYPQRRTSAEYDRFVWIDNSDQPWMNGGTYQVVRKIRMLLETWDIDRIGNQQKIFGRTKEEGAPLSGKAEFDTPNFAAKDADGDPLIDPLSHVGLAARENNDGIMIRRRSYNYTDGLDPNGQLNAGLLFVSYQNDPQNSSACRTDSAPTTCSTNTSATSDQRSSRCRPRPNKATTSGRDCSAERQLLAGPMAAN